jgi:hypothetical protein
VPISIQNQKLETQTMNTTTAMPTNYTPGTPPTDDESDYEEEQVQTNTTAQVKVIIDLIKVEDDEVIVIEDDEPVAPKAPTLEAARLAIAALVPEIEAPKMEVARMAVAALVSPVEELGYSPTSPSYSPMRSPSGRFLATSPVPQSTGCFYGTPGARQSPSLLRAASAR